MARPILFLASLGFAMSVGLVFALQETINEEEYEAVMKEIRFIVSDSQGHIDARYWPELEMEVGRLRSFFEQVHRYWSARGVEAAVDLSQQALQAVGGISTAADEEDQGAARNAIRTLQGVCQSCHAEFREETSDGYRIKH